MGRLDVDGSALDRFECQRAPSSVPVARDSADLRCVTRRGTGRAARGGCFAGDRKASSLRWPSQEGFSLVELMVVLLILGILLGVAIPTYLESRKRSSDRAAQTDLRIALAAAMTHWAQSGSYSRFSVRNASAAEPGIAWRPSGTDPPAGTVTIQEAQEARLLLIARSYSGTYFCLAQVAGSPATDRGRGTNFTDVNSVAKCTGGW